VKKENVVFILDRSQMANNVAQAARAMANFGFQRLRLVAPLNIPSAERMARGGIGVVQKAEIVATLEEAYAGLSWVVGTTGKDGIGEQELVRPEEALGELGGLSELGEVGLVFGCEAHGLTNPQLRGMDRLIHIPTDEACTSVNLAQSVAIMAWELEKQRLGAPKPLNFGLPTHQKRQMLFKKVDSLLMAAAVEPVGRRQVLVEGIRQFLNRQALNNKDVSVLLRAVNLLQKEVETGGGPAAPPPPLTDYYIIYIF
jgi:tRNA/rRNA methyltransferase